MTWRGRSAQSSETVTCYRRGNGDVFAFMAPAGSCRVSRRPRTPPLNRLLREPETGRHLVCLVSVLIIVSFLGRGSPVDLWWHTCAQKGSTWRRRSMAQWSSTVRRWSLRRGESRRCARDEVGGGCFHVHADETHAGRGCCRLRGWRVSRQRRSMAILWNALVQDAGTAGRG